MSEELKPCPFCGCTTLSIYAWDIQPDDFHSAHVSCCDCEARGPEANTADGWLPSKDEAKEEATILWNRRAAQTEIRSQALEEAAKICEDTEVEVINSRFHGYDDGAATLAKAAKAIRAAKESK